MTAERSCEVVRQTLRDNQRPWTSKELERLRSLARYGADHAASELGRTVRSVRNAAHRHRISLRVRGERRGIVLGQARGESWKALGDQAQQHAALSAMRDEHLAGRLDLAKVERLARRQHLIATGTPLCPGCSRNPQERRTTGLCEDCHLRALAQAHRDVELLQEAQRDVWRERQRKVRTGRTKPNP